MAVGPYLWSDHYPVSKYGAFTEPLVHVPACISLRSDRSLQSSNQNRNLPKYYTMRLQAKFGAQNFAVNSTFRIQIDAWCLV